MATTKIAPTTVDISQSSESTKASKISNSLQAIFKALFALPLTIFNHLAVFFEYLDLVKDCTLEGEDEEIQWEATNTKLIQGNVHYLAPFILMLLNIVDSSIIMASESFHYNRTGMDRLFTHKIYPPPMWYPGSCIIHMAMVMSAVVCCLWLFKPRLAGKYVIFVCHSSVDEAVKVIQGGRVWNTANSTRFLAFRRKARHFVRHLQTTVYFSLYFYWQFGLVINYKGTTRDFVCWIYLPFFTMYAVFGVVFISFSIMLSANYMRIQQTFLVKKIETLTNSIRKNRNESKRLSPETIWRRFTVINTEILNFFEQLRAVSQFWSLFLSTYFIGHICMEVFILYGLIFDDSEFDWILRSIFIYFTIEYLLLMLAITSACSAIVRHNVQIYKTNVAFCYAYTRKYKPGLMHQMKMSKMIANYKGTRNGFRLVNNYIVDSKMFEIIFFYLSTIFLKVF